MNQGDLLCVLKEYRPSIPLELQLSLSWQVADGMNYLATELYVISYLATKIDNVSLMTCNIYNL